ncbi:MAG TPA: GNAT family N-acetyltransferase [Phycisphaerae bacterium]|nr:GNAT family N-acetyltransferase [Phycisphaerae bacterium]HNU45554.1 GNAT family N-acetyltransferase [Phycisphaerae bacterium]
MTRSTIQDTDRESIAEFVAAHWGCPLIVTYGQCFYPHQEQGFIERREGRIVGLLTYRVHDDQMHLLTLNSTVEGTGIGTSLILQALETARTQGWRRIWLTTTNDNVRALGFYQRLGFRLVAVHPGAIDEARKLKPQIPEIGLHDIPIRDELVLELWLKPYLPAPAQHAATCADGSGRGTP